MTRTAEHAWPSATDYSSVVQNPSACFADAELAAGQPALSMLSLPLSYAGNFATVYKLQCHDNQDWAVKCFTRPVGDLEPRYAAISDHLERNRRKFAVEFRFFEKGIRVKGAWYPIVKMRWIEGFTLNEFLLDHVGNPSLLEQLAALWLRLGNELHESKMAHGDLQHGNVLLVPGSRAAAMVLRLIDYDGMWVPDLAGKPPGEVGHPNYQHPQRLREGGYDAEIDRFAHLVIYTAFRCLMSGGAALWKKHNNDENLLFKESDFREPGASKLWPDLLTQSDAQSAALAGHLLLASQNALDRVPVTAELLNDGRVRPLMPEQRALIAKLVPAARPPKPTAPPPPVPAPDWLTDAVKQPGSGRHSKLVMAAETLPEVAPLIPVPVPAALQTAEALAGAPRAIAVVDPWAIPEASPAPPVPVATVIVIETIPSTPPLPPPIPVPKLPVAPQSRPGSAPLFPAPDWLLGLGLSPDSPFVRFWPFAIGGVLAVPLLLTLMTVMWLVWPTPPRLGGGGGPIVPVIRPPTLKVPAQIDLRGGHTFDIPVQIDRPDPTEELRLVFTGLPPQVNWTRETVPAGLGNVTLRPRLAAALDVPTQKYAVTVALYRDQEKIDEQPLTLLTRQFIAPEMLDVRAIELRQGVPSEVILRVRRNGNTDPLALNIEPLPRGVTAQPLNLPVNGDRVGVRLVVAAGAELVEGKIVQLTLRAGGVFAQQKNVGLSVQPPQGTPGVQLKFEHRLRLLPGGKAKLVVRLQRSNYAGPVRLALENLPDEVRCDDVEVAADQSRAELHFAAGANVGLDPQRLNPVVEVVAFLGERKAGGEKLLLALGPAEVKPAVVPKNDRMPDPKPVSIHTADGLNLKATFYRAAEPKTAPCVVLVPDPFLTPLGRRTREWTQLAMLLQKQGCSVLAFDFRGFGENLFSTEALPAAITTPTAPGNAALIRPLLSTLKLANHRLKTADQLTGVNFAPAALPWLVQDLVAVRLWLDQQHDAEELNSQNLILVGEGDGAHLAALWLATEVRRYKATAKAGPNGLPYEIRDLRGAVWMDPMNTLRGQAVGGKVWREILMREKAWPAMLTLQTLNAGRTARDWYTLFKQEQAVGTEKSVIGKETFGTASQLTADGVPGMILGYVTEVKKSPGMKPWSRREVQASEYVWDLGQKRTSPAKAARKTVPDLVPLDSWGFGQLKIQ